MAIRINNLNNKNKNGNSYVDIHFDLTGTEKDGGKTLPDRIVSGNDIKIDTDTTAIKNSLINIMTTHRGQRPLTPEFGVNLLNFIGSPISNITGTAIAREVQRGIERWEPRVTLEKLYIHPNPDSLLYELLIVISIKNIPDSNLILEGVLAEENGFRFTQNDK